MDGQTDRDRQGDGWIMLKFLKHNNVFSRLCANARNHYWESSTSINCSAD